MKINRSNIEKMNDLGRNQIPFLFILDFYENENIILPLSKISPESILYDFEGLTNLTPNLFHINTIPKLSYTYHPIAFDEYEKQFNLVKKEIAFGNSYLINLTTATPIDVNIDLKDIFFVSKAKYKLWLDHQFVCFSPETFVKINNGKIYSFPMKGTIDASIPNAEKIILEDLKETSEHYTIVDLIRNDLNLVSKKVKVDIFRYLDEINTQRGKLLQVSSQISGELEPNWQCNIGDIFHKLLPAGSITGAPKKRTVEIINSVETFPRNFYTGVAGIFDGRSVNSMVMIRFIEETIDHKYLYRSGGGITCFSEVQKEYNELIQKIYVPIS